MVNVWDTWMLELVKILVYQHLPKKILQPFSIWQFWYSNAWQQNVFTRTEREPASIKRDTIFELEHYIVTIVPIQQILEIRSLLQFYLFLIVAILFLLNGHLFYDLVTCKCMSTTVRVNDTVLFTFFLDMILNITNFTSCKSLMVILVSLFFINKVWELTEGNTSETLVE